MDKTPEKIQSMFSKVAPFYDKANTALSLGIYNHWYKKVIKLSVIKENMKILDCATGTGNLAFQFFKKLGSNGEVTGIDFTKEMLDIARTRANEYKISNFPTINFESGDVLNLPFVDNSFDIVSIAFGIRNVDSVDICLKEMVRVAKTGGKVVILEFGQPIGILKYLFKLYFKIVMPLLSFFLSLDNDSYIYLIESSKEFPCRNNFLELMNQTGSFSLSKYKSLTFGIAYLYVGIKK
jgi:demethylmenaquinone methyltransferase / 2-methoxy-6-polyprenyl-1,4-benzoquinol methylase